MHRDWKHLKKHTSTSGGGGGGGGSSSCNSGSIKIIIEYS
jgi:hypothetical protein